MNGYTKLFATILDSTIWMEPNEVRILWITMLAMCDRSGEVAASVPGLAARARITLEQCQDALNRLMTPDPFSRTPDHEGRRIEKIDGGWRLLNHAKYRHKMSQDERREYMKMKMREYRSKDVSSELATVSGGQLLSTQLAQAEAKAEAKAVGREAHKPSANQITDDEWLKQRAASPAYQGIDVQGLWLKMGEWCAVHGCQPTRRRMINWLNKEKPMQVDLIENGSTAPATTRQIWKIKNDLEAKEKALIGVRRGLGQTLNADSKWEPALTGGAKVRVETLKTQIEKLKLELETAPV